MGSKEYRARNIYIMGIVVWILFWSLGIFGICDYCLGIDMFVSTKYSWLFWIPFIACIICLSLNAYIWRKPRSFANYETEVDIIEFVERNVGPLILAISLLLTLAVGMKELVAVLPLAFFGYIALALVFACCFVLPLIWIPYDDVRGLVRLRHFKTVPYFYAIFFFLTALISFIISSVP